MHCRSGGDVRGVQRKLQFGEEGGVGQGVDVVMEAYLAAIEEEEREAEEAEAVRHWRKVGSLARREAAMWGDAMRECGPGFGAWRQDAGGWHRFVVQEVDWQTEELVVTNRRCFKGLEQHKGLEQLQLQQQQQQQQQGEIEGSKWASSGSDSLANTVSASDMVTTPVGVEYDGQPFGCAPLGPAM